MNKVSRKLSLTIIIGVITLGFLKAQLYEWRGPGRSGIYNESGLLKTWPSGGPQLVWEYENSGFGYSTPVVTDDAVYITGRKEKNDVLTALSADGKKKWEVIYGKAWTTNHDGTRCTPTYYNGSLFLVSGSGDIVCVDKEGKIKWTKNHFSLFESKPLMFGISESPVVVDNLVIVSPGGKKASMAAFNIADGNLVWTTEPVEKEPQYVNPIVIDYAGKKIIVTVMGTNILGVNAKDGRILWKMDYIAANAGQPQGFKNHSGTPLYRDGEILITNGYNFIALKLKLSPDGNSVTKIWENRNFDSQLGGVVLIGDYLFGTTHQSKPSDSWLCVDWKTGQTLWTEKWNGRGSVISADGMLYLYDERSGHLALAKPNPSKMEIVSQFQITKGEGPYWAHPAIKDGKLYVRHGEYLAVYRIR